MGDEWLAIEAVGICTGWLGGLVLLVVGAFALRPVSPRGGMLLAAAGGAKLFVTCCAFGPGLYRRSTGDAPPEMYEIGSACGMLLGLAVYGLVVAAAAVVAKEILARRAPGGAA